MKFTKEELHPPSLRAAVNKQCKDCIYDDRPNGAGTWRQQIEDCTSYDCSLYVVRPLTATTTKARAEARRLESGAAKPVAQGIIKTQQ